MVLIPPCLTLSSIRYVSRVKWSNPGVVAIEKGAFWSLSTIVVSFTYMCFHRVGAISTPNCGPLKLVDKFTYLGSSVSSTKSDVYMRLAKAWTAIDRLSIIWMSDLSVKIKRDFFQVAVFSILIYGCTTWALTKRRENKLDGNCTRIQRAILNSITLKASPQKTTVVRSLTFHL